MSKKITIPLKKELLAVVLAFNKFWLYLVLLKVVVYTNHCMLRYLMSKTDDKPCLIRWISLLQEFDVEIKDKWGVKNLATDHLSMLEDPGVESLKDGDIDDAFLE